MPMFANWCRAGLTPDRPISGSFVADIVELNPAVDRDGQTARLAAVTVCWLLRGRSERH
jgi:hypothetical protein